MPTIVSKNQHPIDFEVADKSSESGVKVIRLYAHVPVQVTDKEARAIKSVWPVMVLTSKKKKVAATPVPEFAEPVMTETIEELELEIAPAGNEKPEEEPKEEVDTKLPTPKKKRKRRKKKIEG